MVDLAYCTGRRRCASWKSTISATTARVMSASSRIALSVAPVPDSPARPTMPGNPATMPLKMMSEMPLPIPSSEISSPSHTRNIVPATIEVMVATVGSASAPLSEMPLTPPNCWISSSCA